MEAGGKDSEEESLQTAFKKLRVDAESLPGVASISESLAPRVSLRSCLDSSGAKPKLGSPKDNWHGCMRKTSRGVSRNQRRRRSKSPILHPPKFTYCSTMATSALSAPSGCLKQQHLVLPDPVEPCSRADGSPACAGALSAQKVLSSSGIPGRISPLLFGSSAGYEKSIAAGAGISSNSLQEIPCGVKSVAPASTRDAGSAEEGTRGGAGPPRRPEPAEAADFGSLSKRCSSGSAEESRLPSSRTRGEGCNSKQGREEHKRGAPDQCLCLHPGWEGMEVYSFTGLRNVISECERSLPSQEDSSRTQSTATSAASLSRSCSEQARAYVDDITIEDLSGYMEYYLYIPKKMSHMAEMMYT